MNEYYLEDKVMGELTPILTEIMNQVDNLVVVIYFHLIDDYNFVTTSSNPETEEWRLSFFEALSGDISQDETFIDLLDKNLVVSRYIIDILNRLPVTYIQVMCFEKNVSARYYSSVDNSKENVLKVIEGYKKLLREKIQENS